MDSDEKVVMYQTSQFESIVDLPHAIRHVAKSTVGRPKHRRPPTLNGSVAYNTRYAHERRCFSSGIIELEI